MARYLIYALLLLSLPATASAQSALFIRNNSWLDFQIHVRQSGSHNASAFSLPQSILPNWQPDIEVFNTQRDSTLLPPNDSVIYHIVLSAASDSLEMQLRLERNASGTAFAFRLLPNGAAPGPWLNDGSFHQASTTLGGYDLILKFRPDNDDSQQARNLRLAIHQDPVYAIDPADYANRNVINLMAYNVQFLPLGVVGMPQADDRGDLLPAQFSPYQDVIIMEEAFDPLPRLFNLIPAMQAAGFNHNSGILNDYLPFNGGVIIFSRWPIETTAQYDFALCGPASQDCLANKGIMYARINKLGKKYHVFGTHFDAGSDSLDLAAKNLQYAEMRDFIAAQNIPATEAVLMGGDLNTSPIDGHRLYLNMVDSLDPVVPFYSGFQCSTMRTDTGDIIDHVFTDHRHLLPLQGEVSIETFRSIDDVLWDLSDFSDHRSAVGRFVFPDLEFGPGDQTACPNPPTDSAHFFASADIPVTYQWFLDGQPLGNTTNSVNIPAASPADSGRYECQPSYTVQFGTATDPVNAGFYPNGPLSRTFTGLGNAGLLDVSIAYCPTGTQNLASFPLVVSPNPVSSTLRADFGQWNGPVTYQLCDMVGQVLLQGSTQGQLALEVGGLKQGMYVLRAQRKGASTQLRVVVAR